MTSVLFLGNFGGGNKGQIKVAKLIEYLYEKIKFKFIIGLGNNLAFLRDVIRNNMFISGHYGTKFIEEEYPEGFNGVPSTIR